MQAGSAAQILLAWEDSERISRGLKGARFTAAHLSADRVDAAVIVSLNEKTFEQIVKDKCKQENEGKCRCSYVLCNKLFRGIEFLSKHIKLKHADFAAEELAADATPPEEPESAIASADAPIVAVDKKKIYLSVDQGNTIRQVLENHLLVNTPYRKTGYTISDLSNEVSIPSYLLSAFINQEYGKNFNELINEYRVDFFLDLVKQPDANSQYKLEALGKEAGFNTRASFIRAVKKKTGLTPSDFVTKKDN
jgi:AraC-like DNA-binding protein